MIKKNLAQESLWETPEPALSVGVYLDILNKNLKNIKGRIVGEVCNLKVYPKYLFFSLKDTQDQSVVNCFVWSTSYLMSGVTLVDGLEIVIAGFPRIHKPNGGLTFQVDMIQLVGEGALKKAYDALKLKLEKEGLFDLSQKREIPDYPHKIGVITSKNGAVINDFLSNIGKFGYQISFIDSRVEGSAAVKDLLQALKVLKKQDLDVVVIMRGGGSLESFMAFNNEMLVREIRKFPIPIITGVGHDKDVPLVVLASDQNVSTPTAVANLLNKSWEHANAEVRMYQNDLVNVYETILTNQKFFLEQASSLIKEKFGFIFEEFRRIEQYFKTVLFKIENSIAHIKRACVDLVKSSVVSLGRGISEIHDTLKATEKELSIHNPLRQLKLGYSITRFKGAIIKSVEDVSVGGAIEVVLSNGSIESEIKNIKR